MTVSIVKKTLIADSTNYGAGRDTSSILYIVLHYTGATNQTMTNNLNYFHNNKNLKASAHYFVGEDGIGQSVYDNKLAYHCGTSGTYKHKYCRNANSIGIEICYQFNGSEWIISENVKQYVSTLVLFLQNKYNIKTENIIRHFDVTGKSCPLPLVDENKWNKFKEDILDMGIDKQQEKRYNKIEDIPEYAKPYIQKLVDEKSIADKNNMDLSLDMIRTIVILQRSKYTQIKEE